MEIISIEGSLYSLLNLNCHNFFLSRTVNYCHGNDNIKITNSLGFVIILPENLDVTNSVYNFLGLLFV